VREKDLKIINSQPKDSVIPNVSQASDIICVCTCVIVPVSAVVCANIFHTLEVCDTTVSLPKMSSADRVALTHSVSLKGPFDKKFSNQISQKSAKYVYTIIITVPVLVPVLVLVAGRLGVPVKHSHYQYFILY
jgi:hypothetical protein